VRICQANSLLFIAAIPLVFALLAAIGEAFVKDGHGAPAGVGIVFFLALLWAVAFAVAYFLSKKILVQFETIGGTWFGLVFKRSIIENVTVDIERTRHAVVLILHNVTRE